MVIPGKGRAVVTTVDLQWSEQGAGRVSSMKRHQARLPVHVVLKLNLIIPSRTSILLQLSWAVKCALKKPTISIELGSLSTSGQFEKPDIELSN